MNTIEATLVRGTDGCLSIEETIAKFNNDLNVHIAKEQTDLEQVADAVDTFWESNTGLKSVSLDAIASDVFAKLSLPPGAYKDTTDRVKNYIRANTDTFFVQKGKDGGVRLLARMSPEERAKAVETRANAAAKAAAKKAA